MAPCFSLSFDPHKQPKLPSFLEPFCLFSSSPSPPLLFDDGDGSAADSDLNHVIILEIKQRAMTKAMSQPRRSSSFMIMMAEELGGLIKAAPPPPKVNKSHEEESRFQREKDGEYEGDVENEEFFSVRSCFSRCSSGEEEYCLSKKTMAAAVMFSEECFRECEGWPFGLLRRRKVVVLPPLLSPADSWTWHKRNLSNVKVYPVWAASLKQI